MACAHLLCSFLPHANIHSNFGRTHSNCSQYLKTMAGGSHSSKSIQLWKHLKNVWIKFHELHEFLYWVLNYTLCCIFLSQYLWIYGEEVRSLHNNIRICILSINDYGFSHTLSLQLNATFYLDHKKNQRQNEVKTLSVRFSLDAWSCRRHKHNEWERQEAREQ